MLLLLVGETEAEAMADVMW